MAAAEIIINFTSRVADGCHNVCYGTTPGGPYPTCVYVACTPGIGNPCVATISITVDPEACYPTTYYGYIEACCNTEPIGRIPWEATFTPDPTCQAVSFVCATVGIAGLTITNPGVGYSSAPIISVSGGGGGGASFTCTIDGSGSIDTVTLVSSGSGYTGTPTVTLSGGGTPTVPAVLTPILGTCPEFNAGSTCNEDPFGNVPVRPLNTEFSLCYNTADTPPSPTQYSVSPDPSVCCTECKEVTVRNLSVSETLTIVYSSYPTGAITTLTLLPGAPIATINAYPNSWSTSNSLITTFTVVGPCAI
jgi:hypothetical protein